MAPSARRGHLSTKVPNAINRPAPVAPSTSSNNRDAAHAQPPDAKRRRIEEREAAEREDDDFRRALRRNAAGGGGVGEGALGAGVDDDSDVDAREFERDAERRPLLGAVVCTSGLNEQKYTIQGYAELLGAKVEGNLTEDATHLVAVRACTEKYRCAVPLGMHVVTPRFLVEMREKWMADEYIDVAQLVNKHTLAPFEGLDFGLAGFQDKEERSQLRARLTAGGGRCAAAFSLGGSHTHLICSDAAVDGGSETYKTVCTWRRKAEKWLRKGEALPDPDAEGQGSTGKTAAKNMRMAMELKCVRREWIEDSLEAGAALGEDAYLIEEAKPTETRRREILQAIRKRRVHMASVMAQRVQMSRSKASSRNMHLDRVERAATRAHPQAAAALKRPGAAVIVPASLSSTEASTASEGLSRHLNRISAEFPPSPTGETSTKLAKSSALQAPTKSSLLGISRERKFGEATSKPDDAPSEHDAGERDPAVAAKDAANAQLESGAEGPGVVPGGVFRGKTIRLEMGHAEHERILRGKLEAEGAQVLRGEDGGQAPADYCVTTLSSAGRSKHGGNMPHSTRGIAVTHLWVERCLFVRRILEPTETPFATPCAHALPLAGAESLSVAVTAVSDAMDCVQSTKVLLALLGVEKLCRTFARGRNTHLLLGADAAHSESAQVKQEKARHWGIPTVALLEFARRAWETGRWEPPGAPPAASSNQMQAKRSPERRHSGQPAAPSGVASSSSTRTAVPNSGALAKAASHAGVARVSSVDSSRSTRAWTESVSVVGETQNLRSDSDRSRTLETEMRPTPLPAETAPDSARNASMAKAGDRTTAPHCTDITNGGGTREGRIARVTTAAKPRGEADDDEACADKPHFERTGISISPSEPAKHADANASRLAPRSTWQRSQSASQAQIGRSDGGFGGSETADLGLATRRQLESRPQRENSLPATIVEPLGGAEVEESMPGASLAINAASDEILAMMRRHRNTTLVGLGDAAAARAISGPALDVGKRADPNSPEEARRQAASDALHRPSSEGGHVVDEAASASAPRRRAKMAPRSSKFRSMSAATAARQERSTSVCSSTGPASPTAAERMLASRREEDARRDAAAAAASTRSPEGKMLSTTPGTTPIAGVAATTTFSGDARQSPLRRGGVGDGGGGGGGGGGGVAGDGGVDESRTTPLSGTTPSQAVAPRVIYDDPAARRERRKVQEMIQAQQERERQQQQQQQQQRGRGSAHKNGSASTSTTAAVEVPDSEEDDAQGDSSETEEEDDDDAAAAAKLRASRHGGSAAKASASAGLVMAVRKQPGTRRM